ncbi:MAG: TonB-dependent receptor [Sphingobacteriales bacterium]|nr:TonB-dependent receptor [Sphingobacteriales bacterium]
MKNIIFQYIILFFSFYNIIFVQAQEADSSVYDLEEIVISANKFAENKRDVAQQIQSISQKKIQMAQAQNTADLLTNAGVVFVQKSQQGGGSPVLRGFEASRVLLYIDGVRLNNLIYRSGHLQNIITLDNNALRRVEILYGSASTVYGSDALGGVVHLYTKNPTFSNEADKMLVKSEGLVRYGSVNQERALSGNISVAKHRWGSFTSVSYSEFGDLKSGKNKNPFYDDSYKKRNFYAAYINGKDTLMRNEDPFLQKNSGYSQINVLQKIVFSPQAHTRHSLNIQYANSSDVPRYDRLTDPKSDGTLKSAEWYYGPQQLLLAAYQYNRHLEGSFFQQVQATLSTQQVEESRHNRDFGKTFRNSRIEKVQVWGGNIDVAHESENQEVRLGIDMQWSSVVSTAYKTDINTDTTAALSTRYPNGDNNMLHIAAYATHTWRIKPKWVLNDGIRLGYSSLSSTLRNDTFFDFPFNNINQKTPVYSGNAAIIYTPDHTWKCSAMLSSAFRVPNIDDLSKIFDSSPGLVVVPNENLKPEKTLNAELGISKTFADEKVAWENVVYYTRFFDAVMSAPFTFNGADSIEYDGVMSAVFANQNKQKAYIAGFSTQLAVYWTKAWQSRLTMQYIKGEVISDRENTPLDHIPPLLGKFQTQYNNDQWNMEFLVLWNGAKKLKDYSNSGEDNLVYATADGMPAWITANIRAAYNINTHFQVQAGIDNILDTQYRVFASGINAAGRNIFGALRWKF